jgi:hypothetical protein
VQTERERPRKTTSATFRISDEVYQVMQDHARTNNVSVNTLINQLLGVWADSDRFMEEVGLVRITRPNFKRFLEALPEAKLSEMGRSAGKGLARSYIMAKDGEVTVSGVLHYVKGFAQYGGYAKYNETENDGKRVVVLVHDLGRAGSVYIGAYVQSLFELVGSRPAITTTERSVAVKF